jgi:anti-anti-sigma factor
MRRIAESTTEPITIMYAPNGFVVLLTGEIGQAAAQELREQLTWLAALSPRHLILDLSAVKTIDAQCFEVFAELRGSMVKQGGEVRLAGMNAQVRADLQATKLQRLFRIYPSMMTAVCW